MLRMDAYAKALSDLQADLRNAPVEAEGSAARRTLALAVPDGVTLEEALHVPPSACPNCGKAASSERSPYCGPACRDEAAFVRQMRAGLLEGTIFDSERQASLGGVLWHLLGGGYPARIEILPERNLAQVMRRAGGLCETCGAPATTVDHITTACNRPINLRAVCSTCGRTRTFGDPEFLAQSSVGETLDRLRARIGNESAVRPCDDAKTWDWRAFLRERSGK